MKRFLTVLTLVLASAFCANAQGPQSATTRGKFSGFVHYVGRHVKGTFTDCGKDKIWCAYVVGVSLINSADTATTIVGQHRGFNEQNPLLGHHPSTFRLVSQTAGLTVVHLTSMHMLRELYTDKCENDAADPNSMYSRIAAKRGISRDPHRCTVAIDLVGWAAQPYHVAQIVGNINNLKENTK